MLKTFLKFSSQKHRAKKTNLSMYIHPESSLLFTEREDSASYKRLLNHFLAFWLRSSVVSVLSSLISDTSSIRGQYIKWIFGIKDQKL